jgi:hypothetical protein
MKFGVWLFNVKWKVFLLALPPCPLYAFVVEFLGLEKFVGHANTLKVCSKKLN